MKTKKTTIPEDSLIRSYLPADYFDAFECTFTSAKEVKADDVQLAFWSEKPAWVNQLFKLRNFLVKPFKLEVGKKNDSLNILKETIITGKTHGHLSIPAKSDNETVLCIDDRHLKMYLSIQVKDAGENRKAVVATTLVRFHNALGKCYFAVICPFHKVVVKSMLKYVIKKHWL
jgi:hypothetical protein